MAKDKKELSMKHAPRPQKGKADKQLQKERENDAWNMQAPDRV